MPPVFFYFPYPKSFDTLPQYPGQFWPWLCAEHSISPMASGGCFWTLQTYLFLRESGFACELVNNLPDEGIIVSHRDYLKDDLRPGSKQLLVCLRADVNRHPYAQLHVVQNPYQVIKPNPLTLWESHFIPHWPQPSIIPRPPERGDTFENVMFLGNAVNLVPEFRDPIWYEELEKLGLKLRMKLNHDEWHDYSDTDVVLAIREFGQANDWQGKPASKLYNAWHAEVPAILGYESAFRAERKSDLDYLEATTLTEVIAALKQLKKDRELRSAMVENGWLRAKETQPEMMVKRWLNFLTSVAAPAYQDWCTMTKWQQQLFFKARQSFISLRPIAYRFRSRIEILNKKIRSKQIH